VIDAVFFFFFTSSARCVAVAGTIGAQGVQKRRDRGASSFAAGVVEGRDGGEMMSENLMAMMRNLESMLRETTR